MDIAIITAAPVINTNHKKIQEIRFLTGGTFILRFTRDDFQFIAGQYVIVGPIGSLNQREYSIYSGEKNNYIEILVREVADGNVSKQLKHCEPGSLVEVSGPFGSFKLETKDMYSRKHMFIATGTGISPFHSFVTSYPGIDYTILHGIRYMNETYEKNDFDPDRYIPCISKEKNVKYPGRVTHFLPDYKDEPDTVYYFCGNRSMIFDVSKILEDKGVSADRILTEVYF